MQFKSEAVQNLACQVLKNIVRFQTCGCQVLTNMFTCVHFLEDQVMKDIILGTGLMLKLFTLKSFKTWKAKSWIVQSLSRLGDMVLQKNVTFRNLGNKVLKKKISELGLPSVGKYFQMCSCLGRPSHERHNSWHGPNVEILHPEKFQDLESQVLNSAIIVKTWGHGVAKINISKLGIPGLEQKSELGLPSLETYFQMCSCLGRPSHESSYLGLMLKFFGPKGFKSCKAKSWIV